MLKTLYIENIAIIEKASLDFQTGFAVLSGETGAGKSIIIDAISGIMGGRTSRELIRTGEKKAHISAVFGLEQVESRIEALGFHGEQGDLLLERDIFADGRNSCKIGGRPVTTAQLRAVCQNLITIHGQHDGVVLLDEESHIDYLDAFGVDDCLLKAYLSCYEELLAQNRRIKSLSMSLKQREARVEEVNGLLYRLESLSPIEGEYEQLRELRSGLLGAQQTREACNALLSAVDNEEGGGAMAELTRAAEMLKKAEKYHVSLGAINERLCNLLEELGDIKRAYSRLSSEEEAVGLTYEEVETRLESYETLSKKTDREPGQLFALWQEAIEEKNELTMTGDESLELLKEKYGQKRNDTLAAACRLTEARKQAAQRLQVAVERELAYLDMKNARMETEFLPKGTAVKFTKKGVDTVRFLLSANPGENYKPLSKVASGGELSRIMLALKTVLSQGDPVGTMIFDEIDTGVSGRAANKVGEKLWSISKSKQVICVTHLPQIAVYADSHYRVSKKTDADSTVTMVEQLTDVGKVAEIARLTGGRDITETTTRAAQEMLSSAERFKREQGSEEKK